MATLSSLIPQDVLSSLPSINEDFSKESIIHVHLFNGGYDFYLMGYDPKERIMFGYTKFAHMPEGQEFGYTSLDEIEETNKKFMEQRKYMHLIEYDQHWTKKAFNTIDI